METRGLEPQRSSLACASFGGPMAVIRDDPKIVQLHAECALRKLRIFNSAGLLLSETVWNWKHPGGRLTEMSWSDDQTLLGIVQAGTVYRYNIHPELVGPNVSMGKECFEENVIGSTSPAALLYDALDHFDRRSAKADENLRLIRSSLSEAVESCIDAADHEFGVTRQRALLRAANYGQAFSRLVFKGMTVTAIFSVTVRDPDIGIPLSIQQYKLLTPVVLFSRLINAHSQLLALRISEYLGMNKEVVIMHWACAKITASSSTPDAHLLEILLDKLQLCRGISYAAVATHADNCGRRKLAAMLVKHEPRSTKQVCSSLLSIGEEDTGLVKATESGDTDLVYLVIWQKRPPLEFFAILQGRVLARDLFVAYARLEENFFFKTTLLEAKQL
ncbi:hypothetical protein Bca52824_009224 [Brassica carinata]|uniref:Vps16 N-terminal domain-containing protein n=1 Tax=Brassica carinata TaxID=52824 RepID=A0A8X7WAN6_BRACI|nr:hypothetical protein Bca52824_009224 [Brassica carinata]